MLAQPSTESSNAAFSCVLALDAEEWWPSDDAAEWPKDNDSVASLVDRLASNRKSFIILPASLQIEQCALATDLCLGRHTIRLIRFCCEIEDRRGSEQCASSHEAYSGNATVA